jgi:septum formation inhibitor-activating ATPase MinD
MSIARLGYKVVVIDADIGLKFRSIIGRRCFEGMSLRPSLIRDKRWKNLSLLSISKKSTAL